VRILQTANALRFFQVTLGFGRTTRKITLRAVGAHQAYNAAAAVSGAMALGLSFGRACRNLEGFAMASGMRMEWLRLGPHRVLCDAYNANPQSFAAALQYFGSLSRRQPKWVVAGSMFELGKESEVMHQALGRQIRALDPAGVVAVGPASGAILAGLGEDFQGWKEAAQDADAAWRALRKKLDPAGGMILIKGSRGNRLEKMLDAWRTEMAKASRNPGGPRPSQAPRRERA
jgi:UDP-N-acetylmuramoyl-tripeptide--D-alanyl-D-alanine ligase